MTTKNKEMNLGGLIKHQRRMIPLTLKKLSVKSGVSAAHLGRVERGERFPSAHILRKIAKPLGFDEDELLVLAGYLSSPPSSQEKLASGSNRYGQIDPYVANTLAQEPVSVQRATIGLLAMLKIIHKFVNTSGESRPK